MASPGLDAGLEIISAIHIHNKWPGEMRGVIICASSWGPGDPCKEARCQALSPLLNPAGSPGPRRTRPAAAGVSAVPWAEPYVALGRTQASWLCSFLAMWLWAPLCASFSPCGLPQGRAPSQGCVQAWRSEGHAAGSASPSPRAEQVPLGPDRAGLQEARPLPCP